MPSIIDKLKAEERNERTIRLWPDGYGYKAYERSAYLFVQQVRNYHASRRYVDAAGQDVVSIKFPKSVVEQLQLNSKTENDGTVTIRMDSALDEQQFLLWRDDLPLTEMKRKAVIKSVPAAVMPEAAVAPAVPPPAPAYSDVEARLRSFNLAAATPLDCMLLVNELQKMLGVRE